MRAWLWNRLIELTADLVAPLRCAACDAQLLRRALFCEACAATVQRIQSQTEPLALGAYGGALAQALRRLKYGNRPDLAQPLGLLLRQLVEQQHNSLGPIDVVIPVPVPRSRLLERGYNQAALLARHVTGPLGARFAPMAMSRRDGSIKQAALGRRERLENLQGAFCIVQPRAVRSQRVLLVDDVCTTGATMHTCTTCLLDAQAAAVRQLVVALVP